ncbi:MAG: LysR substrate-binding domain-containing protein, partial [Hyphomicrobiales bacterium]
MKNLNRVHLSGLRAVEVVGRLGNLRAASAELGVTVGAVSQQILKTERQLNSVLFERHPKGLIVTKVGEQLCIHLTAGMAELSKGVKLVESEQSETLTVSVPPVFAGKWLVWRLSSFYEAYPDIRIRVDASQELIDPNISDVDVCIRVGWGDWKGVQVEKLLDQRIFPVCTPEIAKQVETPSDLARVPIISEPNSM